VPLCGREVAEVCEHLVADWSAEAEELGALGGGFSRNGALAGTRDLGVACRDLHNLVVDELDETSWAPRRDALLRLFGQGMEPPWWSDFADLLTDFDALGSDEEGDAFLARCIEPILEAILLGVDGIRLVTSIMGGMTSSSVCLVWSEDSSAAIADIQARIATEVDGLREKIVRLHVELDEDS
jgi:hypothetical protein